MERQNATTVGQFGHTSHCCSAAHDFLRARASIARISYDNSVLVSWCLSQPGTDQSPGEIETSGFHHMIAQSI